jgi:hypothetical protein
MPVRHYFSCPRHRTHHLTIWLLRLRPEERPSLGNCEFIAAFAALRSRMHADNLGRYSNTFLVWLNNRISIRNAATARGVANRPQALTLASAPHSDFSADVTFMEMEQSSASIKLPSSASV